MTKLIRVSDTDDALLKFLSYEFTAQFREKFSIPKTINYMIRGFNDREIELTVQNAIRKFEATNAHS